MAFQIIKVGIVGAGTMGGGIAALIAGTGLPVVLLDVPADDKDRNKVVKALWERQRKSSPAALFTPEAANLVSLGNTEDDFDKLRECDWIIEAVIEQLGPKQQLMVRIEGVRKPTAIVSSNTSGIPIGGIGAACGDDFRRHFLGTHFFNPPRYLKLLEVIPTEQTAPDVVAFIKDFGTHRLGKGVVICKDTPGFIANRIGAFVGQVRMLAAIKNDYSVEEVDAITGVLIGNPRTATFRLADWVGLDVIWNLNRNQHAALVNDESREMFQSPEILNVLVAQKALGNKSGAGFYKSVQTQASREFHVLNLKTGEYEPPTQPRSILANTVKDIADVGERINEIFKHADDRDALYLIETTLQILAYAARCVPEICDSIADIDNAMKWGFNSALGPFEIWDAIGVRAGAALMRDRKMTVPMWMDDMLAKGVSSFYQHEGTKVIATYSPITNRQLPITPYPFRLTLDEIHHTPRELKRNASASLHDLGDGVLCLEFHSKGNTLDALIYAVGHYTLDVLENNDDYRALVIGSQGKDFCLGANIGLFLQAVAEAGSNFKLVEKVSLDLQEFLMRFRFAHKPVITAPYQRVLGGGAEVVMAGASVVAAAETYMGLVEFGVGIIPAAGGCKELLRRNVSPHVAAGGVDIMPYLANVFETIAYAKVSESAHIAQQRGFLQRSDGIVLNSDVLIDRAKQKAIQLAESHYTAPRRTDKSVWAAGRPGKAVLLGTIEQLRWGQFMSAHDALIAKKLAHVLCGGDLSSAQWVTEDSILELEREAFASLLGEVKTQERVAHMLKYAKRLRN